MKEFLWTIITTVPVIVYTWFGAHFLRCYIILMTIFIYFLKGFYCKEFLWTIITTVPLTYSLEAQFFCLFLLFPQRVLLNEHFFVNHNYRTSQNICQRRKWAPDQAYTMTSTVVMIVLKISFKWNPLKK